MDSTKIQVGGRYAYNRQTRSGRYGLYGSVEVEVLKRVNITVPKYGKYAREAEVRKEHNANRAYLYHGKAHFLVSPIREGQVADERWVVNSLQIKSGWEAKKAADKVAENEAKVRAKQADERQAAMKDQALKVEVLNAHLRNLGWAEAQITDDAGNYGATAGKVAIDLECLDALVTNAVLGAE